MIRLDRKLYLIFALFLIPFAYADWTYNPFTDELDYYLPVNVSLYMNESFINDSFVPYIGATSCVDLGIYNISADYGFFNNMQTSNLTVTENTTITGNVSISGDTIISGGFETDCLHCEDGDIYFHGDGFFEGNVTAPNIEVMESLIVHGNSTCTGTAIACGDILDRSLCGWTTNTGQRGCYWWFGNCYGTATPCEEMSTATCEEQHVCTLTSGIAGFIIDSIGLSGNFTINTTGNISAGYFIGDGSLMENVPAYNSSYEWFLNSTIFETGSGSHDHDQDLNTTDNVEFNRVNTSQIITNTSSYIYFTTNGDMVVHLE